MTKEEKLQFVKELTEKFKEKPNIYLADAQGLTVSEVNDLRRACFQAGVEMQVIKNTLIKKALDNVEANYEELYPALKTQSSVFFVDGENLNGPAKVIKEFKKTHEKPILKAAFLDSAVFMGEENLDTLAALKSKQELIGEVIALLQSPMKTVIGALKSGGNTIGGLVKTLQERAE